MTDKSTSQLPAADVLTGAEILLITQDGESRQVPLTDVIAYLLGGGVTINWGGINGTLGNQTDLASVLNDKSNIGHTHAIANITGLQSALNGKAPTAHEHVTADVAGLDVALADKADADHTHAISQVTGLTAALAGKAGAVHQHVMADILDFDGGQIKVGDIYLTTIDHADAAAVATHLGYGTWARVQEGHALATHIDADTSMPGAPGELFDMGNTFGSYTSNAGNAGDPSNIVPMKYVTIGAWVRMT